MNVASKICPKCDEKNNPSFSLCWKCHADLAGLKNEKTVSVVYTMQGVGELLEVYEGKVDITPKGMIGFLAKGIKGTKTIPFSSITAIQFKKSGLTSGYLQFTVPGGIESGRGLVDATFDENTFMFKGQNELALEIKNYIEKRMQELRSPQTVVINSGISDELQKLADLKTKGILSEEEFQAAKKQVLK